MNNAVLSDKAILAHMELKNIVIEPFTMANLSTSSYDVTLGPHYYREARESEVFNPYSEYSVARVWGESHEAELVGDWMKRVSGVVLENIADTDRIIWLAPGESILGHTNEFIGGRNCITTMMKSRSTFGRSFLSCCLCSGWGDVGFFSRWTMEITNRSCSHSIPLVIGRRIAQIVFFYTGETLNNSSYEKTGKYQPSNDLSELKTLWKPSHMLPQMYRDREIQKQLILIGGSRDQNRLAQMLHDLCPKFVYLKHDFKNSDVKFIENAEKIIKEHLQCSILIGFRQSAQLDILRTYFSHANIVTVFLDTDVPNIHPIPLLKDFAFTHHIDRLNEGKLVNILSSAGYISKVPLKEEKKMSEEEISTVEETVNEKMKILFYECIFW